MSLNAPIERLSRTAADGPAPVCRRRKRGTGSDRPAGPTQSSLGPSPSTLILQGPAGPASRLLAPMRGSLALRRLLALPLLVAGLAVLRRQLRRVEQRRPSTTGSTSAASCDKSTLELVNPGQLTIATDNPSFPPWFIGKKADSPWDPTTTPTKKGYEAAVAYAVAQQARLHRPEVVVDGAAVHAALQARRRSRTTSTSTRCRTTRSGRRRSASATRTTTSSRRSSPTRARRSPNAKSLADLKDAKFGVPDRHHERRRDQRDDQAEQPPSVYSNSNDVVSAIKATRSTASSSTTRRRSTWRTSRCRTGSIVGRLPQHRRAAGALRPRHGQGQLADPLPEQGAERAAGGRHAEAAPAEVDQRGRPARPAVASRP